MSQKDIDEMSKKIMKWLKEEAIFSQTINDTNTYFHHKVEFVKGSSRFAEVLQPKNKDDLILVGTFVKIPEDGLNKLNEMKPNERMAFFKSIQLVLLFKPIDFAILPNFDKADKIEVTKRLYYDGIDKNKFMDSIREIDRCIFYIYTMLGALSEPLEVEKNLSMFG